MEACRGVTNKRGELSKSHSDIAAGVSGNKLKKCKSHCFTSELSNISRRGASYPGSVQEKGTQ